MSIHDFVAPGDNRSIGPKEGEEPRLPANSKELREASRITGSYQSSEARSKLAENTGTQMLDIVDVEIRQDIEARIEKYKADRAPKQRAPIDDPGIGTHAPTIDYEEMYKHILAEEGSPISYEQFHELMGRELKRASQHEQHLAEFTDDGGSFWASLAGGMQAGFEDPREQASMLVSIGAGIATGGLSGLPAAMAVGAEILGAGMVTASYQETVVDLYKEMGFEEGYDWDAAGLNVGASMLVDTGLTGAGYVVGKAGRTISARRKGEADTPEPEATPTPESPGEEAVPDSGGAKNDPIAPEEPRVAANELADMNDAVNDRAAGVEPTPDTLQNPIDKKARVVEAKQEAATGELEGPFKNGPPAGPSEIAEMSGGPVNVGPAIDAAHAQDGAKKFSPSKAKAPIIEAAKPAWIKEMEAELATVRQVSDADIAHATKVIPELEASLAEIKEALVDAEAAARDARGTDLQADYNWGVKDLKTDRAFANKSLRKHKKDLADAKLEATMREELDALKNDNKVPRRYAKQVKEELAMARAEFEARKGLNDPTATAAKADKLMEDMGAVESAPAARVASTNKPVDIENPGSYKLAQEGEEAMEEIAKLPPDTVLRDVDENNVATDYRAGDMVKERDDLLALQAALRGCV